MTDSWWSDVDDAALNALAAAGGALSLVELASCLDLSEDAARSVVTMLAEQGRVRITAVELARPRRVAPVARRRNAS